MNIYGIVEPLVIVLIVGIGLYGFYKLKNRMYFLFSMVVMSMYTGYYLFGKFAEFRGAESVSTGKALFAIIMYSIFIIGFGYIHNYVSETEDKSSVKPSTEDLGDPFFAALENEVQEDDDKDVIKTITPDVIEVVDVPAKGNYFAEVA